MTELNKAWLNPLLSKVTAIAKCPSYYFTTVSQRTNVFLRQEPKTQHFQKMCHTKNDINFFFCFFSGIFSFWAKNKLKRRNVWKFTPTCSFLFSEWYDWYDTKLWQRKYFFILHFFITRAFEKKSFHSCMHDFISLKRP